MFPVAVLWVPLCVCVRVCVQNSNTRRLIKKKKKNLPATDTRRKHTKLDIRRVSIRAVTAEKVRTN